MVYICSLTLVYHTPKHELTRKILFLHITVLWNAKTGLVTLYDFKQTVIFPGFGFFHLGDTVTQSNFLNGTCKNFKNI